MANLSFSIGADVRETQVVPFPVEQRYNEYKAGAPDPFHIAYCLGFTVRAYVKDKPILLPDVVLAKDQKPTVDQVTAESIGHILDVKFVSPDAVYQYTHPFFELDVTAADFAERLRRDQEMIAQLWGAMYGFGTAAEHFSDKALATANGGKAPATYTDYLKCVATIFNTGANGKPVYQDGSGQSLQFRIKLVAWESRIQFPRFDNFIEVVSEKVSSRLAVKPDDNFTIAKRVQKKGAGPSVSTPAVSAASWPPSLQ